MSPFLLKKLSDIRDYERSQGHSVSKSSIVDDALYKYLTETAEGKKRIAAAQGEIG